MKLVVQRVRYGSVAIDGNLISNIGQGMVVLIGFGQQDTFSRVQPLLDKLIKIRIFSDEQGKMAKSVRDIAGGILLVSQFTLYGDCTKGNRPSFAKSLGYEHAEALFEQCVDYVRTQYSGIVRTGQFGGNMQVQICNDGPVTLVLSDDI